jgi:adenylate cyclase
MKFGQNFPPLVIAVTLATIVFLGYERGLLNFIELKTLDQRFQMRGTIPPRAPIVLVSIDQDSFDELNLPWPWPRTLHAALIRKLAESHAKLIAVDILFTEPKADPREDYDLAKAIKEAGNVILAAELTEVPSDFGPKMTLNLPIPLLRDGALGYGPVNLLTDQDGVIRSARPVLDFQDKVYPSFAYRIYQAATASTNTSETTTHAESDLINFHGPGRTYPIVPYYRVVRNEIDREVFRDKIVLIGSFAPSLHDLFPTPFSASQPMAGVEIQANWIETMLARNPIIPFAGLGHAIIFIALCGMTIWLSLQLSPVKGFAVVSILAGSHVVGCIYIFAAYRIWFPMIPSLFGILLSYGSLTLNNYIRELRERIRVRATFSRYVSADVVEEILEDRAGLGLGGKCRHITVLFSDVRGFTGISEKISPELVVSFLSEYFAQITQIVFKHGGTVDKFIGDGMMAIFGAPKSHGDDALRAVKTGLEMIELVETMRAQWTKILGHSINVGVGINSGDAVVGSIGSEIRSDFTAIGDTVNLASRLEALTKELGVPILISEFTAAELKNGLPLTALQRVRVTGRESPLLVYTSAAYVEAHGVTSLATTEPYRQRHK